MANFLLPETARSDPEPDTPETISYKINPTLLGAPTRRPDAWWGYMLEPWSPPSVKAADMPQTDGRYSASTRSPSKSESPVHLAQAVPTLAAEAPNAPRRGIAPLPEPLPGSPAFEKGMSTAVGKVVRLPDGSAIPDKNSPSGFVMSPHPDLTAVAASARHAAREAVSMGLSPTTALVAAPYLYSSLGLHLGHAGIHDLQRTGNMITGYVQLPHFRNVSNVNVGLFGQQAGFSLHQILTISGEFATARSLNARPNEPYGLDPQTKEYIEVGYRIGQSGAYGPAVTHPFAPW